MRTLIPETQAQEGILLQDLQQVRQTLQECQARLQWQEAPARREYRQVEEHLQQELNPHLQAFLQSEGLELDTQSSPEESEAESE